MQPEVQGIPRLASDKLISIADIREIFSLGRTAAYELTRRPGFPSRVQLSPRCYRWWATEVDAFAEALRRQRAQPGPSRTVTPHRPDPPSVPGRITGTMRVARTRRND